MSTDQRKSRFRTIAIVAAILAAAAIYVFSTTVRYTARWLLHSRTYKSQVLAQPAPPNGTLRHVEWDGSGWAGIATTVVYLVYDPTDSLAAAAASGNSGTFPGLPCEVFEVRRLETHWYTVQFYADTTWEYCNAG